MRRVSDHTANAWQNGVFVDRTRPMARATIQIPTVLIREVPTTRKHFLDKVYSSVVLGSPSVPVELPNLRSVEWNRSIDTDVASCTITLWNNKPLDIGQLPYEGQFDQPGYYSPRRGANPAWAYDPNAWQSILIPDRVIRTYQGYGYDFTTIPELDPFMYATGVWLIDDVAYSADQTIRVTCRDISRLLVDHYLDDPVIPKGSLPLEFFCVGEYTTADEIHANWGQLTGYQHNSNEPWMGGNHLPVNGHYPADSADPSMDTYWLSFGNMENNAPYSYEWVQFGHAGAINAVKVATVGTGYTVYVSLWDGTKWIGDKKIPYDPKHWASYPNGSDQAYVFSFTQVEENVEVILPTVYNDIQAVRFTFTNLWQSGYRAPSTAQGGRFPYRAAVRMAWTAADAVQVSAGTPVADSGNIKDLTHIVAQLASYVWAWWPDVDSGTPFITYSDGSRTYHTPRMPTPGSIPENLGIGDCWGSLELSGTCPAVPLGSEVFHAKTVMEGISYVKEMLGFNFYCDEHGGAVFRSPNLFTNGNYVDQGETMDRVTFEPVQPYRLDAPLYESADATTDNRLVLYEGASLLSYEETLSSRNVRETVRIANLDGSVSATTTKGNVWGTSFRRLALWTDQFVDYTEAQTMADMIGKRIIASATSARMRIPAHPGLQIDDQVWVIESITATYDLHYVRAISSSWDAERGYWFYDLETNRLVI